VTVRRALLDEGLNLYKLRRLVAEAPSEMGFSYSAEGGAGAFLDALRSAYVERLRDRAEWVIESFALLEYGDLHQTLETSLSKWKKEFAVVMPEGDDE